MKFEENKELYRQIHKHPIFQGVSEEQFKKLLDQCTLKHYEKSEKVLYSNTSREGLLLILTGMAEVLVSGDESQTHSQEVLEILQTGDMIGFSGLADFLGEPSNHENKHTVDVRAIEDSYCLQIPYSVIEARWEDETVRDFVLRQAVIRLRDIYASLTEQVKLASHFGESEPFIRRVQDVMNEPVISVNENDRVGVIAEKMVEHSISSMIVENNDGELVGIITEKDLVQRVIAKLGNNAELMAKDVMTANPYTITKEEYFYEAMSKMIMYGVKHLPVVEDHKVIGMLTLSDLMRKKNHGQMEILQKIEKSTPNNLSTVKSAVYDVLGHLINDGIPTIHTLEIITKLYDRLARHCVDLAIQSLEEKGQGTPPTPFCFFLMGSGGRGEQFMLTDQDHFLVYRDAEEGENDKVRDYFAQLGQEIVNLMEKAGYQLCIGKMMSSEEAWRGSLSDWQSRLRGWTLRATNDNILLAQNFFSYRFLYGDESLHDDFVKMIKEQLEKSKIFLYRMAEQEKESQVPTLDHPIRALFRMKRDNIDIKKHALFPLHHCLQVLSAQYGIVEGTPLQRLEALVEKGVISNQSAEDLRFAYEVVLRTRVNMAWNRYLRGEKSTSEIKFAQLRSRDKDELIHALKAIRSLQNQTLAEFGMI